MDKNVETLISEIRENDVRELAEDHVKSVTLESEGKEAVVRIDKRYAMNLLQTHRFLEHFIQAVRRAFGERVRITFRLDHPHHAHEREMLIPYCVHY